MKIFLAAASLSPAYGGPAFSVSRLATALADAGAEVGLWASDQSAPLTPLLPGVSAVKRLSGAPRVALEAFGAPDVLHDNGIWLGHNHVLASLARSSGWPRMVSTRGMLEPWARRHKRWKKTMAWALYQRRDLQLAGRHHATSAAEARNLKDLELGVPISVIDNGVDVPEPQPGVGEPRRGSLEPRHPRVALFLGRIYPVKGLPMLVRAWSQVRPQGWILRIAGPDEAGHRSQVEEMIAAAGLEEEISFLGPIAGDEKQSVLMDADLFVLPSHSESFGMAIGEALAHGLPVLTTTAAPWPLLEAQRCGWSVAPTTEALAQGLRKATSTPDAELRAMGRKGRETVAAEFSWDRVARQFMATYQDLLDSRGRGG